MTTPFGKTVGKLVRWRWTLAILGASSTAVMLWNSLFERSPIIGLSVSLLIFYASSRAAAYLFFSQEKPFVRETLGFAVFVSIASLLGIALILAAIYTEVFSLIGLAVSVLALCIGSALKSSPNRIAPEQQKTDGAKNSTYLVLICSYFIVVAASFYSLLLARTGEGGFSVWVSIPSYFLLLFFLSSLFLVLILFMTHVPNSFKLLLIFIQSLLSHSLFLIVWYPGRYGDPWSFLGEMRFIDREGAIFAYSHLLRNFLVVDIIKYKGLISLALLFERMFNLDIYWVDFVLIPILWSLFVPVFSYKIAESITNMENKRLPLLAAIGGSLFSTLIYWGALAHANALGFIFLLFSIVLLLLWFGGGGRKFWVMSLVVSILTVMTHPQPGIFAFIFLFGATTLKAHLPAILKGISYLLLFLAYPVLLFLHGATFAFSGLANLENLLSFLPQLATFLFTLLFVGLLYSMKSRQVKLRSVGLVFLFYVTVLAGYYATAYGMTDLPYSADRIIAIEDILSVPLAALGLWATATFLKKGFSKIEIGSLKWPSPRTSAMLLICLFLSAQTTLALYSAYPRNDPPVQPAGYEIEAVYYLDSTPERYVVLCEPGFANLAIGFLGSDYAYGDGRGTFGVPEWNWWVNQLSWKMENNPSLDILLEAMRKVQATVGYVVVSTRLPEGYNLQDIVERVSGVLPVDRVFGDGKLYVFKYPIQIVTGDGPSVKVIYDEGASQENVATKFTSYSVNEVDYNLTLSGHSSYNISEYPTYWTFSSLYVNQQISGFGNTSDINDFVYVSKLDPTDVLVVVWQANNLYSKAGWKDDSFKYGWHLGSGVQSTISTDGNIMGISWNFTVGNYYYSQYDKRLNVSTDSYPYLFLKWRTTGPIAEVTVSYDENKRQQQAILGYGSESLSWTVTMIKLLPGENIIYVTLGITNYKDVAAISGLQTLYVDYILISAKQ